MSTTETTETGTETVKIERGLQVRKFDGKIAEDEKTKKPEVKYVYERIVLPWSRTGKDTDGKVVEGAVPSLGEVLGWVSQSGFSQEFELDSTNNPTGQSAVGFLIEGINLYLNRTARVKAENTPESAKDKVLQMFMSKTGMSRADAEKFLAASFSK